MKRAFCTLGGITYEAADFHLTDAFGDKKRYLECPECNGPAFYRGITRNGREACFGARPHAEGCTLATPEHDGDSAGQENGDHEIFTTGQRIILDLNYGTPVAIGVAQPAGVTTATGIVPGRTDMGTNTRDTMHRRMSSILRSLMNSAEFRRSTQTIHIPEVGEFTVADFFLKFDDVTDNHIGTYHGYWGLVPDARIAPTNGSLWLNSGGRENVSVYLDQSEIAATYRRFKIQDEEDIAGAYVLVLGVLRRAQCNGKRYIGIRRPETFSLRLAR